jgi:1-aminocyclopropane-1-carboxylate deaminase
VPGADTEPPGLELPGLELPSPLDEIAEEIAVGRDVRLLLKRDDLIHPDLPGNKWRKLRHNLAAARAAGHDTLLTFGGAYSNHLQATAAAGHQLGFRTVGIVRGEEHRALNPTLAAATRHGMTLRYVDRTTYRTHPAGFLDGLRRDFGDPYVIPEGGANALALRGCAELVAEIDVDFDVICCASGTGATLGGIAAALTGGQRAIGFAVLKGGGFLVDDVRRLQQSYGRVTTNWAVETEFHFGGFARRTPALDTFVAGFRARHGITLDRVYEAKMMVGLLTLLDRGAIAPGSTVVAVLA